METLEQIKILVEQLSADTTKFLVVIKVRELEREKHLKS